jgi:hypothetical protein
MGTKHTHEEYATWKFAQSADKHAFHAVLFCLTLIAILAAFIFILYVFPNQPTLIQLAEAEGYAEECVEWEGENKVDLGSCIDISVTMNGIMLGVGALLVVVLYIGYDVWTNRERARDIQRRKRPRSVHDPAGP